MPYNHGVATVDNFAFIVECMKFIEKSECDNKGKIDMSKVAASLGYYGRAAGRRFGELRRIHGIPMEIFYSDPKDRTDSRRYGVEGAKKSDGSSDEKKV